jgi:hypothetical protein
MAVGRRFDPADHRRDDRQTAFTFDTTGTPMLIDSDGTVFVPGTRVTEVGLDDATVIVSRGEWFHLPVGSRRFGSDGIERLSRSEGVEPF